MGKTIIPPIPVPITITSVTPATIVKGDTITITGTNFIASQGNGFVRVGDSLLEIVSWSDTVIVGTLPFGISSGAQKLTIVTRVNSTYTWTTDLTISNPSQITSGAIESFADEAIRTIVDTRTNIADPRDPGNTGNRIFVYDSDPFNKSISFSDMPYIVLLFPTIAQTNFTADGKHKKVMWKQNLIVRSVRNGASNSVPNQGRADFMSIKDDVMETFNAITIHNNLKDQGFNGINIEKISDDPTVISQEELYEAEYEIAYWTRMQVSS